MKSSAKKVSFRDKISKPTFEHLHDYLEYQYPATKGNITLEAFCQQIAKVKQESDERLEALKLIQSHLDDLYKSNPGFMGKMCLQDYALWNKALLAMEKAIKTNKPIDNI